MERLKLQEVKNLKTAKSYAQMTGFSIQHVYRLMNDKTLNVVKIDGVKFIQL